MNGLLNIYKCRPFISHDTAIELPTCMYRVKNINPEPTLTYFDYNTRQDGEELHSQSLEEVGVFQKGKEDLPDMAALEKRQEKLLEQLSYLKKQMLSIKAQLNITNLTESVQCKPKNKSTSNFQELNGFQEIVVNASCSYPPYSFLFLQRLLKDICRLQITSYNHSSVTTLDDNIKQFVQSLKEFKANVNVPVISVRLIWKEVGPNMEMIVTHAPIIGEINILRFLSRIIRSTLSYETTKNPGEIDNLLDLAYRILLSKTKTERLSMIQILNKSIGKGQWLAGQKEIGIADVAIYSALKTTLGEKELSTTLTKWIERCENLLK